MKRYLNQFKLNLLTKSIARLKIHYKMTDLLTRGVKEIDFIIFKNSKTLLIVKAKRRYHKCYVQ